MTTPAPVNLTEALATFDEVYSPRIVGRVNDYDVRIAHTLGEAQEALRGIFGQPDAQAVLETFMTGQEVSVLALTDGERYALTPPSQDHKTIHEGDTGPMTGGMGVVCPFPLEEAELRRICGNIIEPALAGLRAEGLPFRGVDIWTCYELSWLTPAGKPVVAIGEFSIPADSPNIIESKSFKLYLNSLNQSA